MRIAAVENTQGGHDQLLQNVFVHGYLNRSLTNNVRMTSYDLPVLTNFNPNVCVSTVDRFARASVVVLQYHDLVPHDYGGPTKYLNRLNIAVERVVIDNAGSRSLDHAHAAKGEAASRIVSYGVLSEEPCYRFLVFFEDRLCSCLIQFSYFLLDL